MGFPLVNSTSLWRVAHLHNLFLSRGSDWLAVIKTRRVFKIAGSCLSYSYAGFRWDTVLKPAT